MSGLRGVYAEYCTKELTGEQALECKVVHSHGLLAAGRSREIAAGLEVECDSV